jgi:hypothetical protein
MQIQHTLHGVAPTTKGHLHIDKNRLKGAAGLPLQRAGPLHRLSLSDRPCVFFTSHAWGGAYRIAIKPMAANAAS